MTTEYDCSRRIGVMPGELLGTFATLDEAKARAEQDISERKLEPRSDWQAVDDEHHQLQARGEIGTRLQEVRYNVMPRRR